jgi:hypothetical protein
VIKRWRLVFLAFLLVVSTHSVVLAAAQETASPVVPQPLGVTFGNESATTDYPKGVTFDLNFVTDAPIERAELLYSYAGVGTLNLITAPLSDPTARSVSYFLDLQIYYLPPGLDITYYWRLTGADGSTAETDPQTVTWLDSRFTWTTIETADVRVSTYDGDAEFAQQILDSAQNAVDLIQTDLNVKLDQQVRIWSYKSTEDFSGTQAPNTETWLAGVAFPDLKLILAVLPTGDVTEVGRVIPHEISHQVIHQATDNPFSNLPTWLDEGVAVSYQDNGNDGFPAMVQSAADQGKLFSIRALNSGFPYDAGSATLSYAESFSIVTFIKSKWGEEGLARLIDAYKLGISDDDATKQALGVDQTELDTLWKESLGYKGDAGAAGTVDPSNGNGGSPWADLFASGSLIWVFIAGLMLFVSIKSIRKLRQGYPDDPEDPIDTSVTESSRIAW